MGETILGNRYEIIRKIGDGGMAFVYEAKDKLLSRTVALKVLRPEFVDDDEFLGKFKREAEAVASLSHPNIVNVYDVGEDGKVHYIVMEFVDGQNLKEIIKDEGTLDEYTALDITKQIAMALSAAHKKGIIHRDIKPHNILISKEGRVVKVADFGIAKAVSNSTMTNIGSIIGSVHYFSPEQAKGKYVTNNADLYSLGIVLYEMLTGKVPFKGDSPISIALQHINDEIEFTSEERVSIPQSVRTIIKKLTEKSSADRYQSAEELIEDIEYIEKNIDLDFIKEYDNYATKKIDGAELNKAITPAAVAELNDEPEEEDDFEDDEKPSKLKKNKEKTKNKNKNKKKKVKKEDTPKTKKRLKIAAIVLCLVLATQLFVAFKLISGKTQNAGDLVAPSLESMSLDEAQKELEKLGLKLDIRRDEYNADIPKDSIISQMPASGTAMAKGDTISVVISKGAKKAAIPNIVGYTLEEAENILKENKLKLGNVKQEHNEIYKAGVVLLQSPTSGSGSVEEGDKIDVVISKGPQKEEPKEEPKEEENTTTNPPQNNNSGGSTTNPGTGAGGSTTNPGTGTGGEGQPGTGTGGEGQPGTGTGGEGQPGTGTGGEGQPGTGTGGEGQPGNGETPISEGQ